MVCGVWCVVCGVWCVWLTVATFWDGGAEFSYLLRDTSLLGRLTGVQG